jgi:hypothetical protein
MGHGHDHDHHHWDVPPALDLHTPDNELNPDDLSRRTFLRRAGLLGAGAAAVAGAVIGTPAAALARPFEEDFGYGAGGASGAGDLHWLAGDHHIHTLYSSDALYRVHDQVRHAAAYGLDWVVITDHGGPLHVRYGVEKVNPDIRAARDAHRDTLVFQGLEWNIPAAEHGTVFVHPGPNEVAVLREFEQAYDGSVTGAGPSTPANEALAIAGVKFLAESVRKRRVDGALFLANHPARRGVDSPHEIRAWRDAAPDVAVGMEGAPGHQAAGIKTPNGVGAARGFYSNAPDANSFPGYPLESYRTFGGFDWMTATVGGLWDSLLAEGKGWWITANSDSHINHGETAVRGPGSNFDANGRYDDPVYGQPVTLTGGDFFPGYYSRTHVGARRRSYAAVMEALRNGRVWVDHGGLISGLLVELREVGRNNTATLGETLVTRRGAQVELVITVDLANTPNWANFVPTLAKVDVISGDVTGPVTDPDTFTAPSAKVVKTFEVNKSTGRVSLRYPAGPVEKGRYFRVRGSDGRRLAPGLMGAAVDPAGPVLDVVGDADPWLDLWFYANPIWVLPRR